MTFRHTPIWGPQMTLEGLSRKMNRDHQAIKAIQYLYDEGFIVAGYRDGEPALFLATELSEAQEAIKAKTKEDPSDYWKK